MTECDKCHEETASDDLIEVGEDVYCQSCARYHPTEGWVDKDDYETEFYTALVIDHNYNESTIWVEAIDASHAWRQVYGVLYDELADQFDCANREETIEDAMNNIVDWPDSVRNVSLLTGLSELVAIPAEE